MLRRFANVFAVPPAVPIAKATERHYPFKFQVAKHLVGNYSGLKTNSPSAELYDDKSESDTEIEMRGNTPVEFKRDFDAGLYTFSYLKNDGTLGNYEISSSEDQAEMEEKFSLYFGADNKVKQIQKLGQGLFAPIYSLLQRENIPVYKPSGRIEFIKIPGTSAEEDRFLIRMTTIHHTIFMQTTNDDAQYRFANQAQWMEGNPKTKQQEMLEGNKEKPVSEWAFCSIDQVYELEFTPDLNLGPDFTPIDLEHPILSIYSDDFKPNSIDFIVSDNEAPNPEQRLSSILNKYKKKVLEKFNFDFMAKPVHDEKNVKVWVKLREKEKILKNFNQDLLGEASTGAYGRLCDHMQIHPEIESGIHNAIEQIDDNCVLDNETLIPLCHKNSQHSIFDEKGNLQPWVSSPTTPALKREHAAFSHYLKTFYTIAKKGIQKDNGEFHEWLYSHYSGDQESLLKRAEDKLGHDTLSGFLITSLALRLSTVPNEVEEKVNIVKWKKMQLTWKLIEHQNTVIQEFLIRNKELNELKEKNNFLQNVPEFHILLQKVNQSLKEIPFGDFWKLRPLVELANTILNAELKEDIQSFYAIENFKEQVRNPDLVKIKHVMEVLKSKDQQEEMLDYAAEKFNKLPAENKLHPEVEKMVRLISGRRPSPQLNIQLVYQLAQDDKKTEFATEILTSLSMPTIENDDNINHLFETAIKDYRASLLDQTINPDKYTPFLQLLNLVKTEEESRYIPGINDLIDNFNKIKDDTVELEKFNIYIGNLKEIIKEDIDPTLKLSNFLSKLVENEISKIVVDPNYTKTTDYKQGWTLWVLLQKDKKEDRDAFNKLLTEGTAEDKIVFFNTIKNIYERNQPEPPIEIKNVSAVKKVDKDVGNKDQEINKGWENKLTKIRNPLYRLFCTPASAKSTTENDMIELYKRNKDSIESAIKKLGPSKK